MASQIEGTVGNNNGENGFVEWLIGYGVKQDMIQKLINGGISSVYVVGNLFFVILII